MELINVTNIKSDISTSEKDVIDFDVLKEITLSRVKTTDKINSLNYILKIDNIDKFSKANLSGWIGRAKSKKTFALLMFTGAIAAGIKMYNKFNANVKGKVIVLDTEQSKYDVQVVLKRIKTLINSEDNVLMYGLRPYSPEQRLEIIEKILSIEAGSSELVIIDGIRDLIYDINNPVESTSLITKLMKWSEVYDVHIACVLHQNKGDGNARGHIGSELENKSETVIRITRDETDINISHVEEVFGRGRGILPFSFVIENGLPVVIDSIKTKIDNVAGDIPF